MTSELAHAYQSATLAERMQYAVALADAGILPDAYRKQPANVLVAIETGQALGLHPLIALQQIHVIKGRPAIGSALINSLVRRAGHLLRITVEDDGATVVATIHRSDDPQFEYAARWSIERAQAAGLASNAMYQRHPTQMLTARAVSEVARAACPEVLAGLYSDVEVAAFDPAPAVQQRAGVRRAVRVAVAAPAADQVESAPATAVVAGGGGTAGA